MITFLGNNIVIGVMISILYIILSLYWMYKKINIDFNQIIYDDPKFWVSLGILLYGIMFIFRMIPLYYIREIDIKLAELSMNIEFAINSIIWLFYFISLRKHEKILNFNLDEKSSL